jgi:hypothetical protein
MGRSIGCVGRGIGCGLHGDTVDLFIGHVTTYMALFSKLLWRVDQVLQFRRRAVTIQQVMGPLVVLMTVTLVLLCLWTVLDPWKWERDWVSRVPPETYGKCKSDNFWAFFGPLMSILDAAEVLTALLVYRTSDVPEEFGAVLTFNPGWWEFPSWLSWVMHRPMRRILAVSLSYGYFPSPVFLQCSCRCGPQGLSIHGAEVMAKCRREYGSGSSESVWRHTPSSKFVKKDASK